MSKPKRLKSTFNNGSINLTLDAHLYSQEPLYATCYAFMDDFFISLDLTKDKKNYKLRLSPKKGFKDIRNLQKACGEFKNELINNLLRYKISTRNQKLREFIVREALFFSQPKEEQEKAGRKLNKKEIN